MSTVFDSSLLLYAHTFNTFRRGETLPDRYVALLHHSALALVESGLELTSAGPQQGERRRTMKRKKEKTVESEQGGEDLCVIYCRLEENRR